MKSEFLDDVGLLTSMLSQQTFFLFGCISSPFRSLPSSSSSSFSRSTVTPSWRISINRRDGAEREIPKTQIWHAKVFNRSINTRKKSKLLSQPAIGLARHFYGKSLVSSDSPKGFSSVKFVCFISSLLYLNSNGFFMVVSTSLLSRASTTNSRSAMAMTHRAHNGYMLNFSSYYYKNEKFHRKFYCLLCCEKLLNHSRDSDGGPGEWRRAFLIAWAFIKKKFHANSPKNSEYCWETERRKKNLLSERNFRVVKSFFFLLPSSAALLVIKNVFYVVVWRKVNARHFRVFSI